jgi:hypothetical protein
MTRGASTWRPHIIVVGGFLGSGKTSLILAAAKLLKSEGRSCAVVLNDQGDELVDTRLAELLEIEAREVTGGCFCCRYSDLRDTVDQFRDIRPEIIFAEPVGSCTDIVATVLAPLREKFDRYTVAPFSVLVDSSRANAFDHEDADRNAAFLFHKQIDEADLVLLSKADLYPSAPSNFDVRSRFVSSKTKQGVREWLAEVLAGGPQLRSLDIDYAQYARAEAALAWTNMSFVFESLALSSPATVVGRFIDDLDGALIEASIPIMHLKMVDSSDSGWLKAAICANGEEPSVEGSFDASPTRRHELLLNLRVIGAPDRVRGILMDQLQKMAGKITQVRLDCFSPAAPVPERRILSTSTHQDTSVQETT